MQTLGARFQMRRVSLEPGRQPEAGMGSQIVKRARLGGLILRLAQNLICIMRRLNSASSAESEKKKSPHLGGLRERVSAGQIDVPINE